MYRNLILWHTFFFTFILWRSLPHFIIFHRRNKNLNSGRSLKKCVSVLTNLSSNGITLRLCAGLSSRLSRSLRPVRWCSWSLSSSCRSSWRRRRCSSSLRRRRSEWRSLYSLRLRLPLRSRLSVRSGGSQSRLSRVRLLLRSRQSAASLL